MRFPQFLSIVPQPVKTAAPIIVACVMSVGLIAGFLFPMQSGRNLPGIFSPGFPGRLAGLGLGLFVGLCIAMWVIGLGYVYADARRRAMPPILSTLMAALVPNLLGFLIYFVIRRPVALPCAQCGQAIKTEHRFCSWCGYQGNSAVQSATGADAPRVNPAATA